MDARVRSVDSQTPIEELGFSKRTYNILRRNHLWYVEQICRQTESQLRSLRGAGKGTLDDIHGQLALLDLNVATFDKSLVTVGQRAALRLARIDLDTIPLMCLPLSAGVMNPIRRSGYTYVGELVAIPMSELAANRNCQIVSPRHFSGSTRT